VAGPEGTSGVLLTRRGALALAGGAAVSAVAAACSIGAGPSAGTATASPSLPSASPSPTATPSGALVLTPQETAGPYPLDLHSTPSFFRSDITEGKTGVPLTLTLTILHQTGAPLANARVDIWQCDKDGVYSGYQQLGANTVGQTFLRGIQLTDANGKVTFKAVYPGWYAGRITHIHFQVYLNSGLVATSQLAFPEDVTKAVYGSALYAARGQNASVRNFAEDNVFSDGTDHEMLALTGSVANGFTATLMAVVAA
jgi:protocatechuate 3,4-dioxygenase beta subunit